MAKRVPEASRQQEGYAEFQQRQRPKVGAVDEAPRAPAPDVELKDPVSRAVADAVARADFDELDRLLADLLPSSNLGAPAEPVVDSPAEVRYDERASEQEHVVGQPAVKQAKTEIVRRTGRRHTQAGYERPGRANKRAILVYVDPGVGAALDKAVAASGITQAEFIAVAIQTAVAQDASAERTRLVEELSELHRRKLLIAFPKS